MPDAKLEAGETDGQSDTESNAHDSESGADVAGAMPHHAGEADLKPEAAETSEGGHTAGTPDVLASPEAHAPVSGPAAGQNSAAVAGHDYHGSSETLSLLATALHGELAASLPEVEPERLQHVAHSLTQQAQQLRPTNINTDFEAGRSEFDSQSNEMVQQMLTMQNLSLRVEQKMKIAEMIAKIAKKAIENYDVK